MYNRPEEIKELLESFTHLDFTDPYEIVIVEDGSTIPCKKIIESYTTSLNISYYFKENSGPGDSRNYGMRKAKGTYFIILDSDCLVPAHYLKTVDSFLNEQYYDCFGGADSAHSSFTNLQKAINYVMTSFLTTGGIRGSKTSLNRFEPRSFNMGISKEVFLKTNGFSNIHPGEDPDLSQRILKMGFNTTFLPDAFVYHKRRISWRKFYAQVSKFGLVRPILNLWHPEAAKVTFWFPTLFVLFVIISVLTALVLHWVLIIPLLFYIALVYIDSSIKNKNMYIGALSMMALFIQFFGYGIAFLKSSFFIHLLKRDPEKQFPSLFF